MSSTGGVGQSILSGSQASSSSGGLGAGIDVSTLVQSALANQLAELSVMQGQQTAITNEQTALQSFTSDVDALQLAAQALTDPAGLLTDVSATSSNSSIVSAAAAPGTAAGSHTVVVNSLATTSSAYSSAVATSSTVLPAGTISIQVGTGAAQTITVDSSDDTLDGLAAAINSANIGVSASVINDATGSRLAIESNTSGAPGNLTISSSAGLPTFTQAVAGTNASLTVDGIPISSTTNTVSGAINGVTLTLSGASTTTPVTISLGPDTSDQATAINNYVTAYNKVIGDINTQEQVSSSSGEAGPLASDSSLSLAQSLILASSSYAMAGNGAISELSDLGITMNNDGTLAVDNGALTTALQSNSSAVQSFFDATSTGSFGANVTSALNLLADPVTGALTNDATGLAQTQTGITQQISDFQDQINTQQTALTAEYDQVDTTLQELPLLLSQINSQLSSLSGS
jgi:flagellar hook-associated protein 2